MRFSICLRLFFCLSFMLSAATAFGAQQVEDIGRLRANVRALDRVQHNIGKEIALRQEAGTISLQERNELVIFSRYLQERNRDYCGRIEQQAGRSAVADLPCPAERAALPETKARTVDEELAALDQSLARSLGNFDEMLLKEQERIAARQPRARESGGAGGGGNGDGSGAAGIVGSQGDTGEGASGGGASGQQSTSGQGRTPAGGTAAAGRPGQAGGQVGTVPPAGGDRMSADDDIVARQLREAAEKETDPELKEKLWQEYRKYKEGL